MFLHRNSQHSNPTSLWRWQPHALIWNLFSSIILVTNAFSCFVLSFQNFVIETFPSIRQLCTNTFLYFGLIMCGMTFWWVIIVSTYILAYHVALYPVAFNENIPISVFKANKKAKKYIFLPSTFSSWTKKVSYVTNRRWKYFKTILPSWFGPSTPSVLADAVVYLNIFRCRWHKNIYFATNSNTFPFNYSFKWPLIIYLHAFWLILDSMARSYTHLLCLHSCLSWKPFCSHSNMECNLSHPILPSFYQWGCCLSGLSGKVIKWFCSLL